MDDDAEWLRFVAEGADHPDDKARLNAIASRLEADEDDVERVARALATADGKDPDAPAWVEGYGAREKTFGICWRDQYSDKAIAAILAMRRAAQEPTP